MDTFDRIIGYAAVKRELRQISDTLRNREAYEKLGVSAPRGLLLYGEPGVGKSLMASAVIEASGRPVFLCRKDQPNGDFIKQIRDTFEQAAANAPSIVYLDDMDKFSNGDEHHPDAEEYVAVQSCIDGVRGKAVFVLATANQIRCLPGSLRRAGRFDRKIHVRPPQGEDAVRIIAHYLDGKTTVNGVDPRVLARILEGRSCAELETVINEAGLHAGYARAGCITMEHLLEACLRIVFDVPYGLSGRAAGAEAEQQAWGAEAVRVAWHEAGHAVVSEVCAPGSVTLIFADGESRRGITSYHNDHRLSALEWTESRITTSLGGMAAVEQVFGCCDSGCRGDLDLAFSSARELVGDLCVRGLHLHSGDYEDSEQLQAEQERAAAAMIEEARRKAWEILAQNREFLERLAAGLLQRGLLTAPEIQRIRQECQGRPAA